MVASLADISECQGQKCNYFFSNIRFLKICPTSCAKINCTLATRNIQIPQNHLFYYYIDVTSCIYIYAVFGQPLRAGHMARNKALRPRRTTS